MMRTMVVLADGGRQEWAGGGVGVRSGRLTGRLTREDRPEYETGGERESKTGSLDPGF